MSLFTVSAVVQSLQFAFPCARDQPKRLSELNGPWTLFLKRIPTLITYPRETSPLLRLLWNSTFLSEEKVQEESEVRIPCLQVNFKSPLPLFDVLIAIEHHWVSLSHSQKIVSLSLFEISALWSVSWLNSAKCGALRCFEHFFGSPRWSFEASKDISGSGNSEAASAYAGASGDATKSTTTEDSMAGRAPRQQLAPCIILCQKTYRFYDMGNLLHVCPFLRH